MMQNIQCFFNYFSPRHLSLLLIPVFSIIGACGPVAESFRIKEDKAILQIHSDPNVYRLQTQGTSMLLTSIKTCEQRKQDLRSLNRQLFIGFKNVHINSQESFTLKTIEVLSSSGTILEKPDTMSVIGYSFIAGNCLYDLVTWNKDGTAPEKLERTFLSHLIETITQKR